MSRRLFVAIDLDDEARARIAAVSADLRASVLSAHGRVRVTWVAPERLHLTLHFLGHVDESRVAPIVAAFDEPLPVAPVTIELDSLGVFPEHGRPRVIWIGVGRGADAVQQVHRLAGERLAARGCAIETGPFSPHLTLGRVRDGVLRGLPLRRLSRPARTSVSHVTLYESQLSSEGPAYTPLARAPLVSPAG